MFSFYGFHDVKTFTSSCCVIFTLEFLFLHVSKKLLQENNNNKDTNNGCVKCSSENAKVVEK